MRLAFVVADVRALRPSYATTYLARTATARGHEVGFISVNDLTLMARLERRVATPLVIRETTEQVA